MSDLRLRPWTIKKALPFVRAVHRRLPNVQGAMWAIQARRDGDTVGAALVGWPAQEWTNVECDTLAVLRVAVIPGNHNACSMLYGACSKAAKAMGGDDLVTYTHGDEHGSSLKAAGWLFTGFTDGGEHDRPSRQRSLAVDPNPKGRWFAPWSRRIATGAVKVLPFPPTPPTNDTAPGGRTP